MIQVEHSLLILSLISPVSESDVTPSWSLKPDVWRKQDEEGTLLHAGEVSQGTYRATGQMRPVVDACTHPSDPVLRLQGFFFDRIARIISLEHFLEDLFLNLKTWCDILEGCRHFCKRVDLPPDYAATAEKITHSLLVTLTVDDFWLKRKHEGHETTAVIMHVAYKEHMSGRAPEDDVSFGASRTLMGKDELVDYIAQTFQFGGPQPSKRLADRSADPNIPYAFLEQQTISTLQSTIKSKVKSRNLIVTDEGRIGIGPTQCQEGDEICLFPGSMVPFVLRTKSPCNAGQRSHTFIGDAYIHGAMHGEGG
ncbi:hypothetical protein LTR37_021578 [Vermiconidia calcicola]|uniref:Uncharacterized protein n=1 Tax=Vermiconidia calcicola TaxID=1690605 RepID=A0ACC3M9I1_9PEZI|nr:hypothetical protein LTR37_021578 [Vermiconidia calcicola]